MRTCFRYEPNRLLLSLIFFLLCTSSVLTVKADIDQKVDTVRKLPLFEMQKKVVKKVPPIPPFNIFLADSLVRRNLEMIVQVTINRQGEVVSAQFVSGQTFWREAALNAVKQWKFLPFREKDVSLLTGYVIPVFEPGENNNRLSVEGLFEWKRRSPGSWEPFVGLGQKLGIEWYKKAVDQAPASPLTRYFLGIGYYRQRKYQEAVAEFQTALQLMPDFAEAAFAIGITYRDWAGLNKPSPFPIQDEYLFSLGYGYRDAEVIANNPGAASDFDREKYVQAELAFQRAIQTRSGIDVEWIAYREIAGLHLRANNIGKAVKAWQHYVETGNEVIGKGLAFEWWPEDREITRTILADATRLNVMGVLLEEVGREKEALPFYWQSLKEMERINNPRSLEGNVLLEAQVRILSVLTRTGQQAEAIRTGKRFLDKLEKLYFRDKKTLRFLASKTDKSWAGEYYKERALLFEAMEQYSEAINQYQQAIRLNNSLRCHANLYKLFHRLGQKHSAEAEIKYIEQKDSGFARFLKGDKTIFVSRL